MASGLPVVVTETGGMEELLDGNGLVVPWAAVESLADALAFLISDEQRRADWGQRGRQIAEGFTWPTIIQQYVQLFQRVMDQAPAKANHANR